jgi:hypothetical protein
MGGTCLFCVDETSDSADGKSVARLERRRTLGEINSDKRLPL